MNQGQDESATGKSTVRNQERPPCLTALEQRKKKSCQVPKDESTMKARVTIGEGHHCLQGSMMIESRRKRVPEVRDSSRRGSWIANVWLRFPEREIKKSVLSIISFRTFMSFSGEPAGSLSASGGNQAGTRTAAGGSPSSMSCRE